MLQSPLEVASRLQKPGYLILGLICLQPVADFLIASSPLEPSLVAWRFRFLGLASGGLLLPILGLFLIYSLAVLNGDRTARIVIAWVASAAAVLAVLAAAGFTLDSLQMRAQIRLDAVSRFKVASAWVVAKFVIAAVAAAILAGSAFRGTRAHRNRAEPKRHPVLIGGHEPEPAKSPTANASDASEHHV